MTWCQEEHQCLEGPGSLRLTSEKGRVRSVVPSGGGQGLNWGGDWAQWLVLPCRSLVAPRWILELGGRQSLEEAQGSG